MPNSGSTRPLTLPGSRLVSRNDGADASRRTLSVMNYSMFDRRRNDSEDGAAQRRTIGAAYFHPLAVRRCRAGHQAAAAGGCPRDQARGSVRR
jgi:hypothetical protein